MAGKPQSIVAPEFTINIRAGRRRQPTASGLAFQAAGRIYVMDLPSGTPRRLTADSFDALEVAPRGRRTASGSRSSTLSDNQRGYIWKIAVDGAGGAGGATAEHWRARSS